MKYKFTNNTLDEKSQKKIQESLYKDVGDFAYAAMSIFPEEAVSEDKQGLIGDGMDDTVLNAQYESIEAIENNPVIPTINAQKDKVRPFKDGADAAATKRKFTAWVNKIEGELNGFLQPGDDAVRDVLFAASVDPARDALRGWTSTKAQMRLNSRVLTDNLKGAIPASVDPRVREDVRILDEVYPVTRAFVDSSKAMRLHYDYFDKLDAGTLTEQEDLTARKNILEQEERLLASLDKMDAVKPGSKEAEIADAHMLNKVNGLTKYNGRGFGDLYADTKARVTGLRNGWGVDDLNALSCLMVNRHHIYGRVFYDMELGKRRKAPEYKPGEREYLQKMDKLIDKIEKTRVDSPQTRMNLLNEMHDLMKEGYEKNMFSKAADGTAYDLYTMERTIGRQMSPAELANMQGEALDQMISQYEQERENAAIDQVLPVEENFGSLPAVQLIVNPQEDKSLQNLASTIASEEYPPHIRALAKTYYEKIRNEIAKNLPDAPDPELFRYANAANKVVTDSFQGNKMPSEGAPSYAQLKSYLDGKTASAFSDQYIENNVEKRIEQQMLKDLNTDISKVWEQYRSGQTDPSRVYNLDFISLRSGAQEEITTEKLRTFTHEQREAIHNTYNHIFGPLTGSDAFQAEISKKRNEEPNERLRINGQKLGAVIAAKYNGLNEEEQKLAMEAEALRALADPAAKVTYVPIAYSQNGGFVEQAAKELPKIQPHMGVQSQINVKTQAEQYNANADALKNVGKKLDQFLPGMFASFGGDYLSSRLDRMSADNNDWVINDEEPEHRIRREYVGRMADDANALASALNNQGRIAEADLVRFESHRLAAINVLNGTAPVPAFDMLTGMTDQLKISAGNAPTARQVMDVLGDAPKMEHPFMLISAADSAIRLQTKMLNAVNKAPEALGADGIKDREDILDEINTLEKHVKDMRSAAGGMYRKDQLDSVFDDSNTVDKFVNGHPGSRTILADLEGRKVAITKGWPLSDMDMIAGFYSKRQLVTSAMEGMTKGSDEYMRYARAHRALDEICQHIDSHPVTNAAERKQVLEYINSYGNSLYNDTVATAGLGDNGQLNKLKSDMQKALATDPAAQNFRTAEELTSLTDKAGVIHPEAEADVEYKYTDYVIKEEQPDAAGIEQARDEARARAREQALAERNARLEAERFAAELDNAEWNGIVEAGKVAWDKKEADKIALEQAANENDGLIDLFDQDDNFYTFDSRSPEVIAAAKEAKWLNRVNQPYISGFFDDKDVIDRVDYLNKNVVPGMLKNAPLRLMDDMRAYYLGKGECTYTTMEPVFDDEGKAVIGEDGQRILNEVKHTVPVKNFDQAMELNLLPLEARRQIVDNFLSDLEAHPFGPEVDDATADENARYYARIHKKALQRAQYPDPNETDIDDPEEARKAANKAAYPGLNNYDPNSISRFVAGNSPMGLRAGFSQDFSQNTELFVNSHMEIEVNTANRVRQAYLDEFGGVEEFARLKDKQDIIQGMNILAKLSLTEGGFSLKNRALAKHYLETYDSYMKGLADLSEFDENIYKIGSGLECLSTASFLQGDPKLGPDQGAPTDQQLKDYLDGKTGSPFSDEYIEAVDEGLADNRVKNSENEIRNHQTAINDNKFNLENIYNVSYIKIPRDIKNEQGKIVHENQEMPDLYNLTDAQKTETNLTFDRTLGHFVGNNTYGFQPFYAMMRGESTLERFRINGQKPEEYLKSIGYDGFDAQMDLYGMSAGEKETAMKAALLKSVVDPSVKVEFVPLVMDKDGDAVEGKPLEIGEPKNIVNSVYDNKGFNAPKFPDSEGCLYHTAMHEFGVQLPALLGFMKDADLVAIHEDEQIRNNLKKENTGKKIETASYVYDATDALFYSDEIDDEINQPIAIDGALKYLIPITSQSHYPTNYISGTQVDGSLNATGRKNLKSLKSFMKVMSGKIESIADSYEKINPTASEYLRGYMDEVRTVEDGMTWHKMRGDYTYEMLQNQSSCIGMGGRVADPWTFTDETFKALAGYPTGDPSLRLPQAIDAARRQTYMRDAHATAAKEGILTAEHDRSSRRMLLSELDALEKELRHNNELYLKSLTKGSKEEAFAKMVEDDSKHRKYADNPIEHSTSHYPRGTKYVWDDMEGKRAMLANGWPLEDLNLFGRLYLTRAKLREDAENTNKSETECLNYKRSTKVLDQILTKLENTPIRNAEDRKRMLEYIDSFGDRFYNPTIAGSDPEQVNALKRDMKKLMDRQPQPIEFLSEEELAKAKEQYNRYQQRKNSPNPNAPTTNGPRTDVERAFLNPTKIGRLYVQKGRMQNDSSLTEDAVHGQTINKLGEFLTHVNEFYSNDEFIAPENAAARDAAFKRLVDESMSLSRQIDKSVSKVTEGGKEDSLSASDKKRLESMRDAQNQVRHMRSLYLSHFDYELRRKNDLVRYQQEEQRFVDEVNNFGIAKNREGVYFGNSSFVIDRLSNERLEILNSEYDGKIPEMIEMTEITPGEYLPKVVYKVEEKRKAAAEYEINRERDKNKNRIGAQRQSRRNERASEDYFDAADLFDLEDAREVERKAAAKEADAVIKDMNALKEDDPALKRAFKDILNDTYNKKTASSQAYETAKNDLDNNNIEQLTEKRIRVYEDNERYDLLLSNVKAYLDTEDLRSSLQKKWPEWYETNLAPALANKTDPAAIRSAVVLTMQKNLTPVELHEFLGEQAEGLRPDLKEELQRKLAVVKTRTELAPEDQVVHILHDRAEELNRGLRDSSGHLLDENGVPYHPDSMNGNFLLDENGIPYPPDNERQIEYIRRKTYAEALDYADTNVTSSNESVRQAYLAHRTAQEYAYTMTQKKEQAEVIDSLADEEFKTVVNDLLNNGEAFVESGVMLSQEEHRDRILDMNMQFSKEHLDNIGGMLELMEQMDYPISGDLPGGAAENRAFENVVNTRQALIASVEKGDEQEILAAKNEYEKARNDMDRLFEYAKDENRFPAKSIPGNIDATRNAAVPMDYGKDFYTNSKINGVHNLYSALKWADISIQEFKDDPNAAFRRMHQKALELGDPVKKLDGKSAGEILGDMSKETAVDRTLRGSDALKAQDVINRSIETVLSMDPDRNNAKNNQLTADLHREYNGRVLNHRMQKSNPYSDPKRLDEVQQLLSIVDDESLAMNRTAMLATKPLNEKGYPIETITADDYIAGLGNSYDGYSKIVNRAEEIILDGKRTGGESFDPVKFMENRQKALSTMLVKRAADRNKAGFDLVEDEVLHSAEYYESIRKAHPEANMPALTKAQIKQFNDRSKKFATDLKAANNKLSAEQKRVISDRKAARQAQQSASVIRLEEVRTRVSNEEQMFATQYNGEEANRKLGIESNNPEAAAAAVAQKRTLIHNRMNTLIDQARAGEIPTAYAEKRLAELAALNDDSTAKVPTYDVQSIRRPSNHYERVQDDLERRELRHSVVYTQDALKRRLNLDKHEDPVVRHERLMQEQARAQERRQQEQARREAEREQKRLDTLEREHRFNTNRNLPLVLRLEQRYAESMITTAEKHALSEDVQNYDGQKVRDTYLDDANATRRILDMYKPITEDITPAQFAQILNRTLGNEQGTALYNKLNMKVPQLNHLDEITDLERTQLFTALVSELPVERQRELLDMDDNFLATDDYDFSKKVTFDTGGAIRDEFEEQIEHTHRERINELKAQAGVDWSKMTGGTGTDEQLKAFRLDLIAADKLLTRVKDEVYDKANNILHADSQRYNCNNRKAVRDGRNKPENAFMMNVLNKEGEIYSINPDRKTDFDTAMQTTPTFNKDYITNVSKILRRMDQMQLIKADASAEEGNKIYGMHKIINAKKALTEAIESDLTVAENREKLSHAVQDLKTAQAEMDELMDMARDTFAEDDYMDNMDNLRNRNVPWQYSRNMALNSNLNSVWQFGNLLKASGISVNDFEKDPAKVIENLQKDALKHGSSMKDMTEKRTMGEIAVYGATNYIGGELLFRSVDQVGKLTRGVSAIIAGEPEDGTDRKDRNRFIEHQNTNQIISSLTSNGQTNSRCLNDGFAGKTKEGREALKTLTIIPREDFDPDRMLNRIPVTAEGTRLEEFKLGEYIKSKPEFNYQAQVGRLDQMLKDAAKAYDKIKNEYDHKMENATDGIRGTYFKLSGYKPFAMVQARQQALTELLTLHPENANKPGFAALEDEIVHAAEKYEALRKSDSKLNLPELTKDQKKILETQKKTYLDLKNNRNKLMDKTEESLVKGVKAAEKEFVTEIKQAKAEVAKADERIRKINTKLTELDRKFHQAAESGNEEKGLKLYEERNKLRKELKELTERKPNLEAAVELLRVNRIKALNKAYKEGTLPATYLVDRMQQIDRGREEEEIPKLFGDYSHSRWLKDERDEFLKNRVMVDRGFNIDTSAPDPDYIMNHNLWIHKFWDEANAGAAAPQNAPAQNAPVQNAPVQNAPQNVDEELRNELDPDLLNFEPGQNNNNEGPVNEINLKQLRQNAGFEQQPGQQNVQPNGRRQSVQPKQEEHQQNPDQTKRRNSVL